MILATCRDSGVGSLRISVGAFERGRFAALLFETPSFTAPLVMTFFGDLGDIQCR
jgi:hypothetical protein